MKTEKLLAFGLIAYALTQRKPPRVVPPPRPSVPYQPNNAASYQAWLAWTQQVLRAAQSAYGSFEKAYQALWGPGGIFYKEPLPKYDAGSLFWQEATAGLAGVGAIYREIPAFFQCSDGTFSTSAGRRACRRHGGKKSDLPYQLTNSAGSNLLNIQDVPLTQIHVNHALFQGREKAYSSRSVQNIVDAVANGAFLWENLDPVVLWQSPDGKKYLVSGHSRTEAFRRLAAAGATAGGKRFDRIPAKVLQNVQKEVAQTVALESNTLSTKENDVERAAYYRRLRQDGRAEKQILDAVKKNEGRNANNIYAYTFLSPSGKAWYNLKQFAEDESQSGQITKALAAWIGNARRNVPALTNDHENELTTWLFERKGYGTGAGQVNNAREFSDAVQKFVSRNTFLGVFDPTKPLNIEGLLTKTPTEMEYDIQIEAAKKAAAEADKIWKSKADELAARKASPSDVQRILLPYSTNRQNAYLNLKRLMENKGRVMDYAKNEPALFGVGRIYKTAPPGKNLCADGTYSDLSGRGVCSRHGGVFLKKAKSRAAASEERKQQIEKPKQAASSGRVRLRFVKDPEKWSFHATQTEKKAISQMLEKGMKSACSSKNKCYEIIERNGNLVKVLVSDYEARTAGAKPQWYRSTLVFEILQ